MNKAYESPEMDVIEMLPAGEIAAASGIHEDEGPY